MDITNRLNTLPKMVWVGLKPDFGFIISPDKVQHFPAREWTQEQFLEKIAELFGTTTTLQTETWRKMLVISDQEKTLALLLPKFQDPNDIGL